MKLDTMNVIHRKQQIEYNTERWVEIQSREVNTLQVFITNRCNMRCPECFNLRNLNQDEMSLEQYKATVEQYKSYIEKVILVGGEPTLHRQIRDIIRYNHSVGKRTTIYTNGARLGTLTDIPLEGLSVRVSVFGLETGWKALRKLKPFSHLHVMFTYMLKHDNVGELMETAYVLEHEYGCKDLLISTCRGEDYWTEYDYTVPLEEYGSVINQFLQEYDGKMTIHIATRGVLEGKVQHERPRTCRYSNVFIDKVIQCPFDIAKNICTDHVTFGQDLCSKNDTCVLTKVVLQRREESPNFTT
jgi:hypothetical protein